MSGCWFTRHSEADMGLLGVVCYFKEGKKNAAHFSRSTVGSKAKPN